MNFPKHATAIAAALETHLECPVFSARFAGQISFCTEPTKRTADNPEIEIAALHYHPSLHTVYNMSVTARGQGVGHVMIAALAAHCQDRKNPIENIHIFMVQDGGLSFWPRLGAVPQMGLTKPGFKNAFAQVAQCTSGYTNQDRGLMNTHLPELKPENAMDIWMSLTRPEKDGGLSRPCLADMAALFLKNCGMVLKLTHPEVRARLGLES